MVISFVLGRSFIDHDTSFFFFNDTATTEIYTLSLHDALPIGRRSTAPAPAPHGQGGRRACRGPSPAPTLPAPLGASGQHHRRGFQRGAAPPPSASSVRPAGTALHSCSPRRAG